MKNNKGFSLVELIVVIAIMAILAAVAIPTFSGFITKAKISNDVSFVNDVTYAAKIATVEVDGDDLLVKVTVAEDGTITNVIVTKGTGEGAVNATLTENGDTTTAIEADIHGCIDWDYKFANYTNGVYKLGSDGKTLVSGS